MTKIPRFPRKISTQAIFREITTLNPHMDCVLRWRVARIVHESVDGYWPCPISLRYRFKNMACAAALLKQYELPENTGNLRDHAFATCLRAYNWLEQQRINRRKRVDVTPVQVRTFACLFGFHPNDFRRLGVTSYVCQGSVLVAMSDEMRESFIDHIKFHQ
jgi:hypothetical protein